MNLPTAPPNSNTSATGGFLVPMVVNGYIGDDALEDFLQVWIQGLTNYAPQFVRPAYQEDPPGLPPTIANWIAFAIKSENLTWDPVQTQTDATEDAPAFASATRFDELRLTITFYGPLGNSGSVGFVMGCGITQNLFYLRRAGFAFVEATNPVMISAKVKGRFQRRWDIEVVLRRTVQFSYAILEMGSASGEIITDTGIVTPLIVSSNSAEAEWNEGGYGS